VVTLRHRRGVLTTRATRATRAFPATPAVSATPAIQVDIQAHAAASLGRQA